MKSIFLIITILLCLGAQAQFQEHIIESTPSDVNSIISADLDNDNDKDIIVSDGSNSPLRWIENTDGLGNFNSIHIIAENSFQELYGNMAINDIDGDDNLDILVITSQTDYTQVMTFKNTDGFGNFEWFSNSMPGTGNISSIGIADIDDDNDNDWVSSKSNYPINRISWFENDGLGNVVEHIIDDSFHSYTSSIQLVDVDLDGDVDIIGFVPLNGQLLWYENINGLGNFLRRDISINPNLNYNAKLIAIDLDNDGDLDIIIAYNNIISWYKNDGQGNFGPEIIINSYTNTKRNILVVDLNSDGHLDIISTGNDNSIHYYKNDGQRNFTSEIIIENLYRENSPLFAIDINGDNKIDIISSSSENGKIAWYENTWELFIHNNNLSGFSIFPNPAKDFLMVKSNTNILGITIFNELGVPVLSVPEDDNIDISTLSHGIYFIRVNTLDGNVGFRKFIKI